MRQSTAERDSVLRPLNLDDVRDYVNDNIGQFHEGRLKKLEGLKLRELLRRKNPYLFRAKNVVTSHDLLDSFLQASLSSSEEERFGQFLEALAIFVSEKTCNGRKSAVPGVDLEFTNDGIQYLVSVKSGPNWGNSAQQEKLADHFGSAVSRIKQNDRTAPVESILGCCYGRLKTKYNKKYGWTKIVGQSFWHFLSDSDGLYEDIIEPIGHMARERNTEFEDGRGALLNKLSLEFSKDFCDEEGHIDWPKLVEFNSGNMKQ